MASCSSLAAGDRAFVDEDFCTAVLHYTDALKQAPSSGLYEARAHAYIKTSSYVEAAEDANKALDLDPTNVKAYLRKGVATFYLEEYETALDAFQKGAQLAPNTSSFDTWIRKCQAELDDEAQAAAPVAQAVKATPPAPTPATNSNAPHIPTPAPVAPAAAANDAPANDAVTTAPIADAEAAEAVKEVSVPAPPPPKYRHQHYQIQDKVVVDVYAKAVPSDRIAITFGNTSLKVQLRDEQGNVEYELNVPQLYARLDTGRCRYEALRTKVEVTLAKADPAISWPTLEASGAVAAPNYSAPVAPAVVRTYPTSVRTPRDWSAVESEIRQMEKAGELDEGDALNAFFKKIYAGGDEDSRRAMMKSFVESNGTVLSTNWKEVGAKPVECTPPEGMEVHNWNEQM